MPSYCYQPSHKVSDDWPEKLQFCSPKFCDIIIDFFLCAVWKSSRLFSGKLRPAEQSDRRIVPDHIPRPEYSDHPEGFPISEQRLKGNTYVRQLDSDEIDGRDE